MKLSAVELKKRLDNIVELSPSKNKTEFKKILRIASGNKSELENISLEEIVDLIEKLDLILEQEFNEEIPKINLNMWKPYVANMRRAL